MSALFAQARVVDLIVALVLLEALGLAVLHRATGRGIALARIAGNLAAGLCLLLALRAALLGEGALPVAAFLFGSLLAHLADLRTRWQEP